jgi:hypothetical protein
MHVHFVFQQVGQFYVEERPDGRLLLVCFKPRL